MADSLHLKRGKLQIGFSIYDTHLFFYFVEGQLARIELHGEQERLVSLLEMTMAQTQWLGPEKPIREDTSESRRTQSQTGLTFSSELEEA